MGVGRSSSAFAVALAVHAAVVMAIAIPHVRANVATSARAASPSEPLVFDIERTTEEAPAAAPSVAVPAPPMSAPRARAERPRVPREAEPSTAGVAAGGGESQEAPATPRGAPIALGIGTYWKTVARAAPSSRPDDDVVATMPSPADILRDALDAHDRAIGLGAAGPLVSAAHAASPLAPDVGVATLDVESDATGAVVDVRVVSTNGYAEAWNGVAREIARQTMASRLRVPAGARGVRVRLRLAAERALPSGAKGETNLGAVPDDAPGGARVCEGTGLQRRCVAGMPLGITKSGADVANLVGRAARVLRVEVLREQTLRK